MRYLRCGSLIRIWLLRVGRPSWRCGAAAHGGGQGEGQTAAAGPTGRYLLSGGLLKCPTCGGNFEALAGSSRPSARAVSVPYEGRRKPGRVQQPAGGYRSRAPMTVVLDVIEGEVLTPSFIEELLSTVDRGEVDESARLIEGAGPAPAGD